MSDLCKIVIKTDSTVFYISKEFYKFVGDLKSSRNKSQMAASIGIKYTH